MQPRMVPLLLAALALVAGLAAPAVAQMATSSRKLASFVEGGDIVGEEAGRPL